MKEAINKTYCGKSEAMTDIRDNLSSNIKPKAAIVANVISNMPVPDGVKGLVTSCKPTINRTTEA